MTSAPPPDEQPRPPSSSFFHWFRGLRVTRTPDRWIGGVAGGLAQRTGLDLALVRGLIVVLTVFGGMGVLLYGVAWALLPEPDGRIHAEEAVRGNWTTGATGAAAFGVLGLTGANLPLLADGNGALWTLFWVGAVGLFVYWVVNRSSTPGDAGAETQGQGRTTPGGNGGTRPGDDVGTPDARIGAFPAASSEERYRSDGTTAGGARGTHDGGGSRDQDTDTPLPYPLPYRPSPELAAYRDYSRTSRVPLAPEPDDTPSRSVPARRTRPSGATTALLLGAAATTAGTLLVLDRAGIAPLPNPAVVVFAAVTVVLALGVIGLGLRGRSSGLVGFTAALTLLCALASSFAVVGGSWVVAQEGSTTPSSLQVATEGYSVLASQSTVDLRGLTRPESETVVPISSLASDVTVLVPDDIPVEVRFHSVLGQARILEDQPGRSNGSMLERGTEVLNAGEPGATLVVDARNALGQVTVLTGSGVDPAEDGGTR